MCESRDWERMRLYRLVLALTLLAAFASDSQAQSRNPPGRPNPAPNDQRGTDQMPLSVKILPSPGAEQQERDARERTEADRTLASETQRLAGYTRWLAALTAVLAAIALAQAGLFVWQLRYMRRDMISRREDFVARHRPLLNLRWVRVGNVDIDGNRIQVHFGIVNAGGSDAVITASSINAQFLTDTDWPDPHEYPVNNIVMGDRIVPGASKPFVLPMNELRNLKDISAEEMQQLRFYGYIVYQDILQNTRTTYFCRHYRSELDRFTPVADPDYESAD
jgi:hypothetical protein